MVSLLFPNTGIMAYLYRDINTYLVMQKYGIIHYRMMFTHHMPSMVTTDKNAMNFWGRVETVLSQRQIRMKAICDKHGIQYQTLLNQKSSAHLPTLTNACLLAKELDCSVEWLLFGDNADLSLDSATQLAQLLYKDKRLFAIASRLSSMSQEELFSLEVLLKIRN